MRKPKNTKYLYDESQSPEGMVSVSQIQSFMSCKKKWEYGYVECITPRIDRAYLTVGKLCHKGMQVAMRSKWQYPDSNWLWWLKQGTAAMYEEWKSYMVETDFLDEELASMDQLLADAASVFTQAFEEFQPWKYTVLSVQKDGEEVPALELHFRVPCPPTKGLHGYIDAILRDNETGFVWCTDYKFRKSLSPNEDEAYNIQNAVYSKACAMMGIEITGTMTWQHLNTPAATPQILKDGRVSRAKIKTTWNRFQSFCMENFIDPSPYEQEMKEKLDDIEWFRDTCEYRNEDTVKRIWDESVVPTAKAIRSARGKNAVNYRSLYPWNCKMCQYQSLCQAELRGYDTEFIRSTEYTKRANRSSAPA